MIPRRQGAKQDVPVQEGIPARLARLRAEQSGARRRLSGSSSTASDSRLRVLVNAGSDEFNVPRSSSRISGPPAPPSWVADIAEAGPSTPGYSGTDKQSKAARASKEKVLRSLTQAPDDASRSSSLDSLAQLVGQVIARDLALPPNRSMLLPHLHLLPPHVRLKLFDVAAQSYPLEFRAIQELLREDEETFQEQEEDDNDDVAAGREDVDGEADWDRRIGDSRIAGASSIVATLTALNVAYSPISIKQLRALLVNDSNPARPIPRFPQLSTLNLSGTPLLHFSEPFFAILAVLLPLRDLSLAGKTRALEHASAVPQSLLLPRLAAATPTLESLDLSYASWPTELLRVLDWSQHWLGLKRLGMRREADSGRGDMTEMERDRARRAMWLCIKEGRTKRRWIDIVV